MLTISKALSAGQARTYHAREFVSETQNYWSRDAQVHSEWQGRLAQEWGLRGSVGAGEFARLSEGQHPESGAQLVKHQPAKTYDNEYGKEITSVEHRAGWDATFSAPKSVSLTALVGGDQRVRMAHRESVRVALGELERYTQARIGNIHAPETTAKFIAASFEHDTARPVDGYAAPQLHTHAVIFNMTERENGQTRALQERSLFQSQQYATSVYRSELAMRSARAGLRDRTRQARPAGDQGLHAGISGCIQSKARTDQAALAGDWKRRRGRGAGCCPSHAGQQGDSFPGRGAAAAPRTGCTIRPSGGSGCSPGARTYTDSCTALETRPNSRP
jgi:conjugative relaxase-like TrwC/TraI family protein